ncbi:MAG: tetratricopeptide repeat protein, partial [Armatimonadetes bacterium]|nr:tetratricopeptide repeat protein [Armatimonadota bacterium]
LHTGYDSSEEGQKKKRARDWPLLELDLAERPDHPFDLFNCGMTAHYEGRHPEAVGYLTMSIKNSGPDDSHLPKAYALKSVSLRDGGRPDEALVTLDQGLAAVPGEPELLFLKGVLLANMGAHHEALDCYAQIPGTQPGRFSSVDLGIFTFKKQHNVAVCHLAMGDYLAARHWFTEALRSAPWYTDSAVALFEAAKSTGDPNGVLQAAEAVRAALGPGELWATMHCARADMLGVPREAALEQLWRQFPQAEAPGLLMLRPLLEQGDIGRAAPVLEHLDRTGSAEAAFVKGQLSLRSGDFASALRHMKRAEQRNPGHEQTKAQIAGIQQLLAEQEPVLNGHAEAI